MSKSMEVVIQNLEDRMDLGAKARRLMKAKRLTDAELAAEWQYQDNRCGQVVEGYSVAHDGTGMSYEEDEIDRLSTVYRFATLPHYDEPQP